MKVWNYMMIMLTMMVFLTFMGLAPPGVQDNLQLIGVNITSENSGYNVDANFSNGNWLDFLFDGDTGKIVLAGLGGVVIVGLFTRQFDWKLAVAVGFFTSFVVLFLSFGWGVIQVAADGGESWLVWVASTIFVPLSAMFIFSIVEWFGGSPAD